MAKSAKKRVAAASTTSSRRRPTSRKSENKDRQVAIRAGTKQSTAIEMLRSSKGATIDGLMQATGWQQHSVRGFLAGVVRKRLKLDLASVVVDGVRCYRITGDDAAKPIETKTVGRKS
jgi:hypothetical protein